ncbi:L-asparaginase [Tenacibaculum holothuriorum]|uniref:L-asparaginase n=1 Tax=Tenacibaculum holothuriorum TaxID=1635173 RepID=A0A1Y2PBF8_9FLAO|nr:nuclear transport factor 2 family protein [Tenacibaculum holothuriorum]OSY87331.1 L-asparaginase [Tenacibaculum holothuriorum]
MKYILTLLVALFLISCNNSVSTEKEEKQQILSVMKAQEKAWSNHDLEGFMKGYWKSDSLKFYGSSGLTYGWNKTLANYKRGYPTKDHSGTLKFKVNDISKVGKESYFVMGEYHLTRKVGNANGVFMIIFKKINGEWKIIADTSC